MFANYYFITVSIVIATVYQLAFGVPVKSRQTILSRNRRDLKTPAVSEMVSDPLAQLARLKREPKEESKPKDGEGETENPFAHFHHFTSRASNEGLVGDDDGGPDPDYDSDSIEDEIEAEIEAEMEDEMEAEMQAEMEAEMEAERFEDYGPFGGGDSYEDYYEPLPIGVLGGGEYDSYEY